MLFQKAHKKTEQTDRKNEIKKERKRSPWHFTDPFPPTNGVNPRLSEKVSFCALETRIKRASIAVETVLVLPLFFLGMITMISFMDVYKIQTEHFQSLCEKAKEAGMYAYVVDDKGPEEITLPDVYSYTPVGGLIPLPKVWMHNTVKVHACRCFPGEWDQRWKRTGRDGLCNGNRFRISQKSRLSVPESFTGSGIRFQHKFTPEPVWRKICTM